MNEDFGNYQLVERIGGGSLGEVFRAIDKDGSQVALKRLARQHLCNSEYLEIFAREAQIGGQVQHALLLGATLQGKVGDWPFLITALATEGSLTDRLPAETGLASQAGFTNQAGLTNPSLCDIALNLGEALTALHQQGYTHCDLNPGNVLFEAKQALLADLGSATPLGQKQPRPQGSYAYMSPEQVRGDELHTQSDIFALATLLWQCTTGDKIFARGAQHLTFMAVVEAQPPAMPSEFARVEAVLRQALHKQASQRPSDVARLCHDYAAALGDS